MNEIISRINDARFIVIDSKVKRLYPDLSRAVDGKIIFLVEKPEESKSIAVYTQILETFINAGIRRTDKILAIGGGATSDLAGFVAATILRGIPWEIITTSLLGMIDASIGGKVGVNLDAGKNLVGNFHPPQNIFTNINFLESLSLEDLSSGKGELLKYIYLSESIAKFDNYEITQNLIQACAEYKKSITELDIYESGDRKLLNLGHTFGHAFEKKMNIPHGLAVAIGLEMILKLYRTELLNDYNKYVKELNLTIPSIKINFDEFWSYVVKDKKGRGHGVISLVIPDRRGESSLVEVSFKDLKVRIQENELCKAYFN